MSFYRSFSGIALDARQIGRRRQGMPQRPQR
jgi:hypothetical protein